MTAKPPARVPESGSGDFGETSGDISGVTRAAGSISRCAGLPARLALSAASSIPSCVALGESFFQLLGMRRGERHDRLRHARRVLVVRLDRIGDVVLTSPFLRELRRGLPRARIALVVQPHARNLVELCPYVDEVLAFDGNVSGRLPGPRRVARALLFARRELWRRRFDLAIVPRWDADEFCASLVAYFSGAPRRVGYSEAATQRKGTLNRGYDRLLTRVLRSGGVRHEVERNLDVLGALLGDAGGDELELWTGPEDEQFARSALADAGAGCDGPRVAFGPGAGSARRMWPLANFVEIGSWLAETYRARMVVVGGPGEEALGRELRRQIGGPTVDLVGRASLRGTAAVLKRCRLFLGNDAGPMHLAAAAGAPVVEISCHPEGAPPGHANAPERFRPWRVAHVVCRPKGALDPCSGACSADRAHCITGVSVRQVKRAVEDLWT